MREQSTADRLRATLAEADHHKSMVDAVSRVQRAMRLGAPVAVRRGRLGWLRWTNEPTGHYEFEELGGDLNQAVYEALSEVRGAHQRRADEIERSFDAHA